MPQETVLIVGATGNIGLSAVRGALDAGYHILAIVRNETSANKIFNFIGSKENITTVEADIMSETGVQGVVDRVKAGELPDFQHVYACAGGLYSTTPLTEISTEELREIMKLNFESNFLAYRATIPYLLSHPSRPSTWTLCTGASGDVGNRAAPAMTQGALFSLANVACQDLLETNVRFNELYLALRVEEDESAEKNGVFKASDFARAYEGVLKRDEVRSARVIVNRLEEMSVEGLRWERKRGVPYGE